MDKKKKDYVDNRNHKIIEMIIERAKRDFKDDIAIIALTGSLLHGDYHEKSDIDLVIINNTEKGWKISYGFILDGIGYDIYCSPWDGRIEEEASLSSPRQSNLLDIKVLYYASEADLNKLHKYQARVKEELAKPVNINSVKRAWKFVDNSKKYIANAFLADDLGHVRNGAGHAISELLYAIAAINNTYYKGSIKDFVKEATSFSIKPDNLENMIYAIIDSKSKDDILLHIKELANAVSKLVDDIFEHLPDRSFENLNGTYEELISNTYNKILHANKLSDRNYCFTAAISAQDFLDEMHKLCGTPAFSVLEQFDSDNLQTFTDSYIEITRQYRDYCEKSGVKPKEYESFEALYADYMKKS